jgi:hypothetical protein
VVVSAECVSTRRFLVESADRSSVVYKRARLPPAVSRPLSTKIHLKYGSGTIPSLPCVAGALLGCPAMPITALLYATPLLTMPQLPLLLCRSFVKWNNNAGAVRVPKSEGADLLGAIRESDDEEEDGSSDEGGEDDEGDTPQCFSHFTWSVTDGDLLVCDLQGVWNEIDGFLLTDPAMHRKPKGGRQKRGGTDKGADGIADFFRTHRCSARCRELGLRRALD